VVKHFIKVRSHRGIFTEFFETAEQHDVFVDGRSSLRIDNPTAFVDHETISHCIKTQHLVLLCRTLRQAAVVSGLFADERETQQDTVTISQLDFPSNVAEDETVDGLFANRPSNPN
jgi:hypothetical protein